MNFVAKISLLLVLTCVTLANAAEERGTRMKISDSQLNMALNDERYLKRQLKCALGEATCDPVGRRLKSLVPLVMRGSCPQCTEEESLQIRKVISHIQRMFPKEWGKLVKQYAGAN